MKRRKVLLIGWDAADWDFIRPLIDAGEMPALASLIENGVSGNLATLQPVLSPMLWNSIATGKQPWRHGIHGFVEPDLQHGGMRAVRSSTRECRALWNMLTLHGLRSNVVNWWASHPAEAINGCVISNLIHGAKPRANGTWVAPKDTVHPAEKAEEYSCMRVMAEELTVEQLLPFIPKARTVDQNNNPHLAIVAGDMAEMITTHNVTTAVMEIEPWDFMAVYYTAIDHFGHHFMQFHPPRLPWIPEADFEMYKDVMRGVYRFHDLMLRRLLELAGEDATVILCSDHGFHSGEQRPFRVPTDPMGPIVWHRRYGMFVASGPGIKKGGKVHGATLLDVAPTILSLFGLPCGEDMDGRPLLEIFETKPEVATIPSWDDLPGECGMQKTEGEIDAAEADALLGQFVALGYVDAPGGDKKEQADFADTDRKYNLAMNLAWCGKSEDARRIFLELVWRHPWESRFILQLARCYLALGNLVMADRVISSAYDRALTRHAPVPLIELDIMLCRGDRDEAALLLTKLEESGIGGAEGLVHAGNCWIRLKQWDNAARAFGNATKLNPENAEAWQGLSSMLCRKGRNQETVDAAMEAVSLVYHLPKAHLNLGIALARSGDAERAAIALNTALQFNPNVLNAHRWLVLIHEKMIIDPAKAWFHRGETARILSQRIRDREKPPVVQGEDELPVFPSEEERDAIAAQKRPRPVDISRKSGRCLAIVSGLPRSGTSLMMQMLEAGGLPPKTDGRRVADDDNPKGYYEWEEIKQIGSNPRLLDEDGLEQKAIKVVSPLLGYLPYQHEYRVIFMLRPIAEVVDSQAAMLKRNGDGSKAPADTMARELSAHRDAVLRWLQNHPRAKVMTVDYPTLIQTPQMVIGEIVDFLGVERLPNADAMQSVIDRQLHRNRSAV